MKYRTTMTPEAHVALSDRVSDERACAKKLGSEIVAQIVTCVIDRETLDATPAQVYAWAGEALHVDEVWSRFIGPAIDEVEQDALREFGERATDGPVTQSYLIDVTRTQTFEIEATSEEEARTLVLDGRCIDEVITDMNVIDVLPDLGSSA